MTTTTKYSAWFVVIEHLVRTTELPVPAGVVPALEEMDLNA